MRREQRSQRANSYFLHEVVFVGNPDDFPSADLNSLDEEDKKLTAVLGKYFLQILASILNQASHLRKERTQEPDDATVASNTCTSSLIAIDPNAQAKDDSHCVPR